MASQWRIRHKLMLGLGLVMLTIALLLGGTLRGLWSNHQTINGIRDGLKEQNAADKLREAVAELARSTLETDVETFTARVKTCREQLAEYEKQLNDSAEHVPDAIHVEHERGLIAKLTEYFNEVEAVSERLNDLEVGTEPDKIARPKLRRPLRECVAKIEKAAEDLRAKIKEDLDKRLGPQSRDNYQKALWIIIPTTIVGVLTMAGLMRSFYGWIFYPIRDLEAGVKCVAQGNFDHRIEVHSGDEMEDLAAAFNDMTGRLREFYADLARQVNERSRQLVRSERLASVGFLAAGVAHEINNPLASIAFCSEALESRLADLLRSAGTGRRTDDEEVFARYLKMIQEEAFRCKKITEKLLEFSRSSERRRDPIDLGGLVQSVIDITQHLQSCKGKEILFDSSADRVPSGKIAAPVNAEEIKSVVLNLVVNALDSMGEGGRLTIKLGLRDGLAEIRFVDTGCGMTQEVLENIFEPFFTRSRTGKGTGLGLTISHRIVNQHGGEIEATSEGPGKGSTFIVRLPLVASEPRQAQSNPIGERKRRAA